MMETREFAARVARDLLPERANIFSSKYGATQMGAGSFIWCTIPLTAFLFCLCERLRGMTLQRLVPWGNSLIYIGLRLGWSGPVQESKDGTIRARDLKTKTILR